MARGASGPVPRGARHLLIDRTQHGAYDALEDEAFDAVVELTWQPGFARAALDALSPTTPKWLFVSSVSVYADHSIVGMDETATLLGAYEGDDATLEVYGEAKVACEEVTRRQRGDSCSIVRPGLIGGPGDLSDRSGAWVARCAAAPTAPLLVPSAGQCHVQVIDVRDLAAFIVAALEAGHTGTYNTTGVATSFASFVDSCRRIGGHHGEVREVSWQWLEERGINQWAGPDSMACFVDDSDMVGWGQVNSDLALAHGLMRRPLATTLADTLVDEKERGSGRSRRAGLSRLREEELLAELGD